MALPPLTPEQRSAALEKAAASRRERAEVKHRLKHSGRLARRGHHRRQVQRRHRQDAGLRAPGVAARGRPGARPPDHGGGRHLREPPRPWSRARTRSPRSSSASGGRDGPLPPHRPRRTHRRRQGDRRGLRPRAPPRGLALGLGDDPPSATRVRSTASTTTSSTTPSSTGWPRAGELLEWAVVHGRARYGTPRRPGRGGPRGRPAGPARDRPPGRPPGARRRCREALFVFLAPPDVGRAGAPTRRPGHRGRGGARGPAGHRAGRAGRRRRSST